ncbi:MAG: rod shape-determining protein RodA [bacterium]
MFQSFLKSLFKLDWLLIFSVMVLLVHGLLAIYSLSLSREPDTFFTLKKQFVAIGLGLLAMIFIAKMSYKTLRSFSLIIYVAANAMLVAVLVLGKAIRGTTGWFEIGPINFQPVECAKIAVIIVLARYFAAHTRDSLRWREVFESAVLVGIPVALTMLQPDLGSALVLLGMWTLYLIVVGLRKRVFIALVLGVILIATSGWFMMAPYQKDRITVFMHPESDPLGQGYNVTQARIAIGAGGFFGRGVGFGSQSQLRFLPESMTDFIVSVIGEELGFVGMLILLLAFAFTFYRLVRVAENAADDFGSMLALGVLFLILIQFSVNIGMNLSMLPVTGITLPFVSYGASSLIFMLIALGIAQSVASEGKR